MRPITKGKPPHQYGTYQQVKDDLRNAIGSYCSYCEMNISNQPDIEHVVPKSRDTALANDWDNLLLACKTCNTIKSNSNSGRIGYLFPDQHNTAYAFLYSENGVEVNPALQPTQRAQAQATLDLVKVNRATDTSGRCDDRKFARSNEWRKAADSLNDYLQCAITEMVQQIARSPTGFISIWLHVLKDHPEVKAKLLESIPGTAMDCYCENYHPCERVERCVLIRLSHSAKIEAIFHGGKWGAARFPTPEDGPCHRISSEFCPQVGLPVRWVRQPDKHGALNLLRIVKSRTHGWWFE